MLATRPASGSAPNIELDLEWKKAICGICPAGCWVEVGMRGNTLAAVRQDTGHPLGQICRRGQHAPEIVYSPHRLKYPMRRVGPKGSYNFERVTWDQAYEIIVDRFNRIKEESGPEAVAIYTGRGANELSLCDMFQPQGVAVSSASSVLFPFGSPNTMGVGALCYVSLAMIAPHVTMGRMQINMFNAIEVAGMVFVWGTNPSTDSPPVDLYRLETAAGRGADIVVIDPRRTETVVRTGAQWVPIRPGTDGALALAMIQVMIEEDLLDEDFAEKWCQGFEELKSYVQHFTPETVETITTVPAATIRDLVRRLCRARGACPLMYTGFEYSNTGVQATRAVLTLFALAGQLDVPGGIGFSMLNTDFPINRACNQANPDLARAVARSRFPLYSRYRGESHAIGLVDSVLKGDPYRIRALLVDGASMLTSWPQTPIWRRTLTGLHFLVCVDRQLTADAAYADLVLPATTMFEINSYMTYGPVFRLREKVIEPIAEARNDYLIMAGLAERLGYGRLYPQTEEEMVRFALQGSGYTLEDVRAAGGFVRMPTPMMEYRKWQKGGLRPDGRPGFDTPTGKFEIRSTILEEYGYEPLPKYAEPTEGPLGNPTLARQFPLVFNSGARPQTDFRSQFHGIDGLVNDNPEPIVEVNIEDAAERRIRNGDRVTVSTPRGAVPFRARVTGDIMKGAVECNMGGGTPVGPRAWQEWNVNELTDLGNLDPISGFPVYKALLCQVSRVETGIQTETVTERATEIERRTETKTENNIGANPQVRCHATVCRIYLDNNATTEVAPAVREAMMRCLEADFGNPSSIHRAGLRAREAVEQARRQVARLINASPRRLIFTSGGSEADNLAIKGIAFACRGKGNHIITSSIEHPAVLSTGHFLEKLGYRITYLPVDGDGLVSPDKLREALTPDTILVSLMMANNEVGTILPVKELCAVSHERQIPFHTDAVQAVGKVPVDVQALDVDFLSLSGHKFHGPKGIGVLYARRGIPLEPLVHGGNQEGGQRAGTENVPAIAGLGKAAEMAMHGLRDYERTRSLRDTLENGIRKLVPGAQLNGHPTDRLPNTLNLTLPGLRGESLVIAMDQHGICFSSGSACKSGSPEPTHVLMAMGRTREQAHAAVRFSLSRYTTQEEIHETLEALSRVLEEKNMVRLMPCK